MSNHTIQGFSATRLERINTAIANLIGPKKLSGAVTLLARNGEVVHRCALGSMDLERNKPMRMDALFRMYSMTKPITCVAMMMLIEEGKARLLDPASRFLPAFRNLKVMNANGELVAPGREVTLRDLFNHTSGISYHWLEYGPVEQQYRETLALAAQSLTEHIDALLTLPLSLQPGEKFRYSESHDVLARIIEVISGQTVDAFFRERIFAPLGMNDTAYHVPAHKLERFTAMYGSIEVANPSTTITRWYSEAIHGKYQLLADPATSLESTPHNVFRGGNGLVSTADDYLRFCQMLLNGGERDGARILGRSSIELMTRNTLQPHQLPYEIGGLPNPGYGMGLGMRVLMDPGAAGVHGAAGEYGWGGAANTYFWIDPAEKIIGIALSQYQPSGFIPLGADFRTAAYQALV